METQPTELVDGLIAALESGDPLSIAAAVLTAIGTGLSGYLTWKKRRRVITAEATDKEEIRP